MPRVARKRLEQELSREEHGDAAGGGGIDQVDTLTSAYCQVDERESGLVDPAEIHPMWPAGVFEHEPAVASDGDEAGPGLVLEQEGVPRCRGLARRAHASDSRGRP